MKNQRWVLHRGHGSRLALAAMTVGLAIPLDSALAAETTASRKASDQLEEIVVTAQKRTENLQTVPISVQVIGKEQLVQENHNNLTEITRTVPAVHIATGAKSNSLTIRGIGSGENPTFDQSVATFSDDIYHGRSRMTGATFLDSTTSKSSRVRRAPSSATTPSRAP